SPRRPSSTMRIFSSAEYCRRVWRRMSFRTCSAGALPGPDFCFIFAPCGYDETEILPSGSPSIGLTGADGEQCGTMRMKAALEGQYDHQRGGGYQNDVSFSHCH